MSLYREVSYRSLLLLGAGISLFYLTGCTNMPNEGIITRRDVNKFENNYSHVRLTRTQSEQDRYDSERKSNDSIDLLNHIDQDIKDSVKSAQEGVNTTVGRLFPGDPKLKKSKLVWTKSW